TAYAVHRPDDQWSLLIVNRDQHNSHPLRIVFHDTQSALDSFLSGETSVITFGSAQYQWHSKGKDGFADPDGPPASVTIIAREDTVFELPAASMAVIRGRLAERGHAHKN